MQDTPTTGNFDRFFAAHRIFDGSGNEYSNGTIHFSGNKCLELSSSSHFIEKRNTIFHSGTLFPSLNNDTEKIILQIIENLEKSNMKDPDSTQLEALWKCHELPDLRMKWTSIINWLIQIDYPGNLNDWIRDFCSEPFLPGKIYSHSIWWIDRYDFQKNKPHLHPEIRETIL